MYSRPIPQHWARFRTNDLSSHCISAGEQASVSGGLGGSITRLVLRLVLLYVQQAPLPRARDCVQQGFFLLPHLLDAGDTLSRYRMMQR